METKENEEKVIKILDKFEKVVKKEIDVELPEKIEDMNDWLTIWAIDQGNVSKEDWELFIADGPYHEMINKRLQEMLKKYEEKTKVDDEEVAKVGDFNRVDRGQWWALIYNDSTIIIEIRFANKGGADDFKTANIKNVEQLLEWAKPKNEKDKQKVRDKIEELKQKKWFIKGGTKMGKTAEILKKLQENEDTVLKKAEELAEEGTVTAFEVFKGIKGALEIDDTFKLDYGRVIREMVAKKKKKNNGKPGRSLKEWLAALKKKGAPDKVIMQFKKIHDSVIEDGGNEEHAMRAAIDKVPKKYLEEPEPEHGPKKKKYPLSKGMEENIFKMMLEGKTEDEIKEYYAKKVDEFFLKAVHISYEDFLKNFKCAYPDFEAEEEDIKSAWEEIYPALEEKAEKPEDICVCEVVKAVYDKVKGKAKKEPKKEEKKTGPGGHEPDGTGPPPHGRGMGPGKGKGDGSGLE